MKICSLEQVKQGTVLENAFVSRAAVIVVHVSIMVWFDYVACVKYPDGWKILVLCHMQRKCEEILVLNSDPTNREQHQYIFDDNCMISVLWFS